MTEESARAPSDEYFAELLHNPFLADEVVRTHAPTIITDRFAEGLPTIESGRLIMPQTLASRQCDVLLRFRLREGNPGFVWVLIEHKSWPDPETALQVAACRDWIWTRYVRQRPPPDPGRASADAAGNRHILPVVYPIVVYNGRQPWTGATSVSDMVSRDVPLPCEESCCRFRVLDIRRTPPGDLARGAALRAGLFVAGLAGENRRNTRSLLPAFRMLEPVCDSVVTIPALTFIMRAFEIDSVTLRRLAREAGLLNLEDSMQTIYEQLRTKGIAEGEVTGEVRGIVKGNADMLLLLLRERFGTIPGSIEKRVRSASSEQLDDWSRAMLTAAGLDGIFGGPTVH